MTVEAPDRVTQRYLDECLASPEGLRRAAVDARLPADFTAWAGANILARPLFFEQSVFDGMNADVAAYLELLTSLPWRLFDGDVAAYCAALSMSPRRAELLARYATKDPVRYGRADLYDDGSGYRLLEFNVASDLGGVDMIQINRALLRVPAFAEFARAHRLSYVDTAVDLARCLRDASAPVSGARRPSVGVLAATSDIPVYETLLYALAEVLRDEGLAVVVGDVADVELRSGKPAVEGQTFDVVLRYFTIDNVLEDPAAEAKVELLDRAAADGTVVWWTPLDSSLYSNKGCMAMLSDPRWRHAYSDDEIALLDHLLPWTRLLSVDAGATEDEVEELVRRCRDEQEDLVLKPLTESSGKGILAGWQTERDEWNRALDGWRDRTLIVQRRVAPRPDVVVNPHDGTLERWISALGVFHTPYGFAGGYARVALEDQDAIVNIYRNPEVRFAAFFSYPDSI